MSCKHQWRVLGKLEVCRKCVAVADKVKGRRVLRVNPNPSHVKIMSRWIPVKPPAEAEGTFGTHSSARMEWENNRGWWFNQIRDDQPPEAWARSLKLDGVYEHIRGLVLDRSSQNLVLYCRPELAGYLVKVLEDQ